MKVLLLDEETTGIVSLVYSQTEILQEEVYLFERIDANYREEMPYIKAFCFLRPTGQNLRALQQELRTPKYGEYYLIFTNLVSNEYLKELAQADEHEVVQQVQEFYGDYYAVNPDCWTLNLPPNTCLGDTENWGNYKSRILQGLFSCLLSLKVKPYIRTQNYGLAASIGNELNTMIEENAKLFQFKSHDYPPILLILDRREDPVTPLLTQWTYQAMVHELIGIKNDIVELKSDSDKPKQMVLSAQQDSFYREKMFKNFGDFGIAIKSLVDEYQVKKKLNSDINTIEDMKRFVADYPDFKKLSSSVSKHVSVVEQLHQEVKKRFLLDLSEFEQTMVCNGSFSISEAVSALEEYFKKPGLYNDDLLRLVILFALRYETHKEMRPNLVQFIAALKSRGVADSEIRSIEVVMRYGGAGSRRTEPLFDFNKGDIFNIIRNHFDKGLAGVNNIYTQHKPMIHKIIEGLISGRLSVDHYPFQYGAFYPDKPQQILLFILGGITFEEACYVAERNMSGNMKILLGGTSIHNSRSFLSGLNDSRSL